MDIATILLAAGADVNAEQQSNFTPLLGAAHNGQLEMVKLLLSHGADREVQKSDGQTAYDVAREKGYTKIAMLLEKSM
ncbi:ankyrin repeat domain-containing protein [Chloroflexi bacterium TSY]|nr:ankyrin repeat domain-containing protein [Chloroflexi bacterium TSY]